MKLELPFPPASLSGHNEGAWYSKSPAVSKYRADAYHLTVAAMRKQGYAVPEKGDIAIRFTFVPPDRRGDRTNFPIRIKPGIDGIADAFGTNDARFQPTYSFAEPEKPGKVIVTIGGVA